MLIFLSDLISGLLQEIIYSRSSSPALNFVIQGRSVIAL